MRRLESIPVPCNCDNFAHERCLVIWFNRQFQCPTCRKKLIPRVFVDGGAGPRSDQGEGIPIYLRRESLSTQEYFTLQGWDLRDAERHRADDHNDDFEFIPQLQPPPGWGEYMRREHPPIDHHVQTFQSHFSSFSKSQLHVAGITIYILSNLIYLLVYYARSDWLRTMCYYSTHALHH